MAGLFTATVFPRNLLSGNRRRNNFFFFTFLCLTWETNPGLTSTLPNRLTRLTLFILFNYNTITNYILIIYELSSFDHVLGAVTQIRVSGGNRTH